MSASKSRRTSLTYETEPTLVAARCLWGRLQHSNVMLKVPPGRTTQDLPVIRRFITEGINVNVTLFSTSAATVR